MELENYIKKLKKSKNYKNTLSYSLLKRNGKGIVDSLNKFYSEGITDINQMIKKEIENVKTSSIKNSRQENLQIKKFKSKNCIIFNNDFMECRSGLADGQEFGLKDLVKILEDSGWSVFINKGKGDSVELKDDINLLIKYQDCNTKNSSIYISNPDIDLVFGCVQNKWVNEFINKYKIYSYNFPESCKIPSKKLDDYISEKQFEEIKDYIEKNKNDIVYDKFIVKPFNTFSGKGIFYIDKKSKLSDLNEKLNQRYFPYVIQPLIKNISRYKNKVNHLRTHILVSCFLLENNKDYEIRVSLYDKYFILLAKDEKSYDSHGKTTDHFRSFKDYYDKYDSKLNYEDVVKENKKIVKTFEEIIRKNFKNFNDELIFIYPDRKSTFSLFAMDLMITEEGHLKLIEINYKVGTTFWVENQDEIKEFMNWIYKNGIEPMI